MARPKKTKETTPPVTTGDLPAGACQRCGHDVQLHIDAETQCTEPECDCAAFVYPPDPEGQHHLPGEEYVPTESQKELWPLTMAVKEAQDERMRLLRIEIDARAALLTAMKKHNLMRWEYKGIEAEIDPGKEKVKDHATGEGILPM